jgi:alpha-tubulin suppressor-like RCC1 family protein
MAGPNPVPGVAMPVAVSLGPPGETNGCSGCALLADMSVACWGCNSTGQLGNGAVGAGSPTAAVVPGLTGVTEVSVGSTFACALKMDGTVWCWGDNAVGQLGIGSTTASSVPMRITAL